MKEFQEKELIIMETLNPQADVAPTETGHTPGPWQVFTSTDGTKVIGIGETNGQGITDCGFGIWRDGKEAEANARLIAAAPELLGTCKELLRFITAEYTRASIAEGYWPTVKPVVKRADDVIAKAEGKSP